jgi:FeS assembly SUF system protein
MEKENYLQLETEIIKVLKEIYDPEIPVNVYDLGLIYKLDVSENNKVSIDMTLTAPNCPIADQIFEEVRSKIADIKGVSDVVVNLVFDPPWSPDLMAEEAKLELGFL